MKEKSPAFRFYPGDFLSDPNVIVMDLDAIGAYTLLLCYAWREMVIPDDVCKLAKYCRVSEEKMAAMWPAIRPCFKPSKKQEGFLMHPRLESERKNQKKFSERASQKGKKGAKARWDKVKKGDSTGIAKALLEDGFSFSFSSSDRSPLTPQGSRAASEGLGGPVQMSAASLVSEFQAVLKTQGKTVFGEKWFAQNVKLAEELLSTGQTPEDIRECMHWLAKEAEMAPYVNHFKQIIRHWNIWAGQKKAAKPEKVEYWQRILAAKEVQIDSPDGTLTVCGSDLDYDSKGKRFIYRGQEFDVCFVHIAGRVA